MVFLWLKKIDEDGTGRKNKRPRITLCPAFFPLHPQNRTGISIYEKLEGGKEKKEIRILILVKSHQMPKQELVGMERVDMVTWAIAWNKNVLFGKRLKHILFFKYGFDHVVLQQNAFSFRLCLMCLITFSVLEGLEAS